MNTGAHSAVYFFDLDQKSTGTCLIVKRVPIRTIIFFLKFEQLNYEKKQKWIQKIHQRTGIPNNKGIILLLQRQRRYNTEYHIDKYWDHLISMLVHRGLQLETEMWRLSTLGGAVSAMGFFENHFTTFAFRVSIKQLQIAQTLGDPILIARCRLYIALSLAQKKQFRLAKRIVRDVWAEGRELKSELLKNCARGVWVTIKWMKYKKGKTLSQCKFGPSASIGVSSLCETSIKR